MSVIELFRNMVEPGGGAALLGLAGGVVSVVALLARRAREPVNHSEVRERVARLMQ